MRDLTITISDARPHRLHFSDGAVHLSVDCLYLKLTSSAIIIWLFFSWKVTYLYGASAMRHLLSSTTKFHIQCSDIEWVGVVGTMLRICSTALTGCAGYAGLTSSLKKVRPKFSTKCRRAVKPNSSSYSTWDYIILKALSCTNLNPGLPVFLVCNIEKLGVAWRRGYKSSYSWSFFAHANT